MKREARRVNRAGAGAENGQPGSSVLPPDDLVSAAPERPAARPGKSGRAEQG